MAYVEVAEGIDPSMGAGSRLAHRAFRMGGERATKLEINRNYLALPQLNGIMVAS